MGYQAALGDKTGSLVKGATVLGRRCRGTLDSPPHKWDSRSITHTLHTTSNHDTPLSKLYAL